MLFQCRTALITARPPVPASRNSLLRFLFPARSTPQVFASIIRWDRSSHSSSALATRLAPLTPDHTSHAQLQPATPQRTHLGRVANFPTASRMTSGFAMHLLTP